MAYYPLNGDKSKDLDEIDEKSDIGELDPKKKAKRKKLKKIILVVGMVLILLGGFLFYRASSFFSKISSKGGGLFDSLTKSENDVAGVKEGRINILLLGERGSNMPGGSLLADTIMIASIKPSDNKVALISIPRDLYVDIPGHGTRKINGATVFGEEAGKDKGMELMQQVIQNVTGLQIHYVVTANFQALREIVDTLGGINVHLDKPFSETSQFVEGNECGGIFSLPAGDLTLNGDKALCYSRARYNTSDFDRARRQQDVIMAIKAKALSLGVLTDFNKLNDMLNILGDNIRTTMAPWEMQKLFGIAQKMDNPGIIHKVIDNGTNGLLYSSMIDTSDGPAYILRPKGDNYDKIKELCANIFDENAVNNIIPPQTPYQPIEEPKTSADLKKAKKANDANLNANANANSSSSNKNTNASTVNKNSNTNSSSSKNSNTNSNNKNTNTNSKKKN